MRGGWEAAGRPLWRGGLGRWAKQVALEQGANEGSMLRVARATVVGRGEGTVVPVRVILM